MVFDDSLMNLLQERAKQYHDDTVAMRRHLHRHPELSTEEVETARYIAQQLRQWGIPYRDRLADTGLCATITGVEPDSRCVALRADMDALPITEQTGLPFASERAGVMHACGHDAHMACLLGAARLLQETRTLWKGTVKLIFQPSEEDFRSGAPQMIAGGVLENPKPQHIYAMHVLPDLPAGQVGMKAGQYMASTDELYLTVKGKGGHAATPELNVDTVILAANILTSLQQVVSRQAPPYIPTVLSFGRIIGEGRTNIIPSEVHIEGTIRTFNEDWRKRAHENITRCAVETAKAMGGDCDVTVDHGYPFVLNDAEATQRVRDLACRLFSADNVAELPLRMTAEDFAYYSHLIPTCLFRLGTANPNQKGTQANLHTPEFTIDESALLTGVLLMAALGIAG